MRVKHGYSYTKEYAAWRDAKRRCNIPNHPEYKRYGEKGIKMSEEFLNNPQAWCEHIGPPPDNVQKWSVDRINPFGNYERGNLKWALPNEQTRNQKKQSNNTSGITGVSFHTNSKGVKYWMARWHKLNGKVGSKSFSINKYGDELALFLAEEVRDIMIKRLNILGASYSEQHGK